MVRRSRLQSAVLAGAISVLVTSCAGYTTAAPVTSIPAPNADENVSAAPAIETAVLAGGCFWGMQGVFEHVKGVNRAVAGYAGGDAQSAHYDDVSAGDTGHAESVQISYDPKQISYGTLLQIYFAVAHDPTEIDRQGPDVGTQYRSAIFAQNDEQRRIAEGYITQLTDAHAFTAPIATKVESGSGFFPAEDHHQDYMVDNPDSSYIKINDAPKLAVLQGRYPAVYREQPVLVRAGES